jgi:hypothetical protein
MREMQQMGVFQQPDRGKLMRDKTPNLTDYEKTYREFKSEIPEYYNFGFDGIDRWAEDRTKLALISVDDTGINALRHNLVFHIFNLP